MESYFKAQGTLRSPYFIGLRGNASGLVSPYSGFTWRDGPDIFQPSEVPSSSVEQQLAVYNDYSHFGANANSSDPYNTNLPAGNCFVADSTLYSPYWFYDGTNSTADRQDLDNYIDSANATLNLWAWRRVGGCVGSVYMSICMRGAAIEVRQAFDFGVCRQSGAMRPDYGSHHQGNPLHHDCCRAD